MREAELIALHERVSKGSRWLDEDSAWIDANDGKDGYRDRWERHLYQFERWEMMLAALTANMPDCSHTQRDIVVVGDSAYEQCRFCSMTTARYERNAG